MTASDDKKIWQAYARGVKRALTQERSGSLPTAGRARDGGERQGYLSPNLQLHSLRMAPSSQRNTPFTKKVERALRQGAIDIDARLDLHGMTQAEAYGALERFMVAQVKAGRRNLLIITGKGSKGHGVLRANLPHWLESLPNAVHILELRTAAVKHGGSGAFYLILKRRKK